MLRAPRVRSARRSTPITVSRALLPLLAAAALGLAGCQVAHRDDAFVLDVQADTVRVEGPAAEAKAAPDGRPYQFRAVCIEPRHPGSFFVLSKWVDDIAVARDLGQYHGDHKAKGHRWHIERRIEPHAHS